MEGYAFELTPEREIVWEFRTPQRIGKNIPTLNDVMRVDPAFFDESFRAMIEARKP
jgi:hypothetical protein